jgi:mono/diheme cytochrome c family protein
MVIAKRPARRLAPLVAALIAAAVGSLNLSAQTPRGATPPLVIPSMEGRALFEAYCASCHGRDGRGGGPAVAALKLVPPDLTVIGKTSGGQFPRELVEAFVTGDRETAAHGSKEMPVWGPIFSWLDPAAAKNRVRISNIVDYIESMQRP